FLPGSYYYWWSRRMKPRPEDDPNATQADGAGVVGSFPGTSIWPFTLGMGAFSCVLALVFGIWLLVPGLGLVIWAMFGGTSEGRRGGHV
ncbi:MAG: cytochrome c oxidase subunit 4, partial [Acidobacteriota bacterium]|nr:cytochrome c oxidase subunit 4 [Acidobacteriota bacterium]MDE3009199.1 cytochrome c oxidase subunit 4 [Acidobacteriota bacterium]